MHIATSCRQALPLSTRTFIMHRVVGFALLACTAIARSSARGTETFEEALLLRPLADGQVLAHFSFTTRWKVPETAVSARGGAEDDALLAHFGMFPKVLGQLLHRSAADEFRITFSRGAGGMASSVGRTPARDRGNGRRAVGTMGPRRRRDARGSAGAR